MATKAELEARVAALERQQFRDGHQHIWRYSKHVTIWPKDSFNPGRAVLYSWTCVDEKCDYGSGGTNTASHVPDHFPVDLR